MKRQCVEVMFSKRKKAFIEKQTFCKQIKSLPDEIKLQIIEFDTKILLSKFDMSYGKLFKQINFYIDSEYSFNDNNLLNLILYLKNFKVCIFIDMKLSSLNNFFYNSKMCIDLLYFATKTNNIIMFHENSFFLQTLKHDIDQYYQKNCYEETSLSFWSVSQTYVDWDYDSEKITRFNFAKKQTHFSVVSVEIIDDAIFTNLKLNEKKFLSDNEELIRNYFKIESSNIDTKISFHYHPLKIY